jgi:hypothetical protein
MRSRCGHRDVGGGTEMMMLGCSVRRCKDFISIFVNFDICVVKVAISYGTELFLKHNQEMWNITFKFTAK